MRLIIIAIISFALFFQQTVHANPYWNPQRVPKDESFSSFRMAVQSIQESKIVDNQSAIDVLRIQVDWLSDESFKISKMVFEPSGTSSFIERSKHKPHFGSYVGMLKDIKTNQVVYYDSIGTGKEYRKLTRAINLRFPKPNEDMIFELLAENPLTGQMEKVIEQKIIVTEIKKEQITFDDLEIRELALASKTPSIRVNIYAEGYLKSENQKFWEHAMKTVHVLQKEHFPGVEYMSFYGVFHSSNRKLGTPQDLGMPIPDYDSFLGLYYPYWDKFGRWYDVVYPTSEDKLRRGLAVAAYDYPLVLINHSGYWGVGNYMSLTAIPAASSMYFTYLLLHEFGHFFGLNEEYEGGGPTELEFARDIDEPWSQNITFLVDKRYEKLKWKSFVNSNRKLPTPDSDWKSSPPVYGAYRGGYADSASSKGRSHKPGLSCIMENKPRFCEICKKAILDVIQKGGRD